MKLELPRDNSPPSVPAIPASFSSSLSLPPHGNEMVTSNASLQFFMIFQAVVTLLKRRNVGKRPVPVSNFRADQQQFYCDFENGWCPGFFHNKSSPLEWLVHQGAGYNPHTGPTVDHTSLTEDGHYAYFNGSMGGVQQSASFFTPLVNMDQSLKYCLSFWYHMRGRDFGALEVFWKFPAIPSNETGFEYLIFSRKVAGSVAGHDWKEVRIAVYSPLAFWHISPVFFEFRATRGVHRRSDIAIDDIRLSIGDCGNCTEQIRNAFAGRRYSPPVHSNPPIINSHARFHVCPHSRYQPRLCGDIYYDASSHSCCQNVIRLGTGTCCGKYVMAQTNQQCCGGKVPYWLGGSNGCCGGRIYYSFFQDCCNEAVYFKGNRQNPCRS